jgi:glucose-1-phosphate thymidylyltransferase
VKEEIFVMKGIILHGGHGTRLRPLTHTGPKQLLPIANMPMSQYGLETMKNAGINEIAIIIGGIGSQKVKEYYGTGKKFGVKISYIEQDLPKGIAHAVGLCKEFVNNEKFLVFLGDNIISKSILDFTENFKKSDDDASILLCEVDNPSRFGIANIKENKIIEILEKPKNPPTNLAVTGIYFLTPLIFEIIKDLKPSWRNELEITDALDQLLKMNKKISHHIITDYWKDTGTPEDIIHANRVILEKMKSFDKGEKEIEVKVSGNVMIGKNTKINGKTEIIGPVIIGENCVIESGTRIGPNASIGDNTFVSKAVISNSIIMANCKIDADINIKNSIIAFNSSITSDRNAEKIFLVGEGTKINL